MFNVYLQSTALQQSTLISLLYVSCFPKVESSIKETVFLGHDLHKLVLNATMKTITSYFACVVPKTVPESSNSADTNTEENSAPGIAEPSASNENCSNGDFATTGTAGGQQKTKKTRPAKNRHLQENDNSNVQSEPTNKLVAAGGKAKKARGQKNKPGRTSSDCAQEPKSSKQESTSPHGADTNTDQSYTDVQDAYRDVIAPNKAADPAPARDRKSQGRNQARRVRNKVENNSSKLQDISQNSVESSRNSPENDEAQGDTQKFTPKNTSNADASELKTENTETVISDKTEILNATIKTPKMNAFQMMMDARNKSIGRNSPGKELDLENGLSSDTNKNSSQKKIVRNEFLQSWADSKGASKRKREYEETGHCIASKLEKRAKRMKKMLNIGGEQSGSSAGLDGALEAATVKKKSHKSSSSDRKSKKERKGSSEKSWKIRFKDSDASEVLGDPEIVDTDATSTEENWDTVNGSEEIKQCANSLPESRTNDGDLSGQPEHENSDKEIISNGDKVPKIKQRSKRKSKRILSESSENDFDAVDNKRPENPSSALLKISETQVGKCDSSLIEANDSLDSKKNKQDVSDKNYTNSAQANDHVSSKESASCRNLAEKCEPDHVKDDDLKGEPKIEERTDADEEILPNRRVLRKRKTKMNWKEIFSDTSDDDSTKKNGKPLKKPVTQDNITSNETKRTLRRKTAEKTKIVQVHLDSSTSSSENEKEKKVSVKKKKTNTSKDKAVKVAPVFLKATPKPKMDPKVAEARRQFLMSGVPSALKKDMEKQQSAENQCYEIFPTISHVQQKSQDSHSFWNLSPTTIGPEIKFLENLDIFDFTPPDCKSLIQKGNLEQSVMDNKDSNLQRFGDDSNLNSQENQRTGDNNLIQNPNRVDSVKNIGAILKELKIQNPQYPVYKVFKSLYAKSDHKKSSKKCEDGEHKENDSKPKKRGRKKKKSIEPNRSEDVEKSREEHKKCDCPPTTSASSSWSVWTEKYKPTTSGDILGNHRAITTLRNWLKNFSSNFSNKRNSPGDDSESDFETGDGDCSRDSTDFVRNNTLVLKGPNGCGKSTAVYAVCQELDFNVLEINASGKRTGKKLLQEVQEATQSHQVKKSQNSVLSLIASSATDGKKKSKKSANSNKTEIQKNNDGSNKMCVLLVEDVDIVFDQDEGFVNALNQIMTNSKRPVILTTSSTDSQLFSIQRSFSRQQIVEFQPLVPSVLAVWLQILCLVESGALVTAESLGRILNFNRGDVRKTLLEVQFLMNSGFDDDDAEGNDPRMESTEEADEEKCRFKVDNMTDELDFNMEDESSNLSVLEQSTSKHQTDSKEFNKNICTHFQDLKNLQQREKGTNCFTSNNLHSLWWNLPRIFNWSDEFADFRLNKGVGRNKCDQETLVDVVVVDQTIHGQKHREEDESEINVEHIRREESENLRKNQKKLHTVSELYDCLTLADISCRNRCHYYSYSSSEEYLSKRWFSPPTEGHNLEESMENYRDEILVDNCLQDCLVEGRLKQACEVLGGTHRNLPLDWISGPGLIEKRWYTKQISTDCIFEEALQPTLERSSTFLDYLPYLRSIARSERSRASHNTKRNNRFYNYLRSLNVNYTDSEYQSACNAFLLSDLAQEEKYL